MTNGLGQHTLAGVEQTSVTSAVDAPVAILRVYSSCPGVSAMIEFVVRVKVSVSNVDGDALFAFSAKAIRKQCQVEPVLETFAAACNWSS